MYYILFIYLSFALSLSIYILVSAEGSSFKTLFTLQQENTWQNISLSLGGFSGYNKYSIDLLPSLSFLPSSRLPSIPFSSRFYSYSVKIRFWAYDVGADASGWGIDNVKVFGMDTVTGNTS